MVDPNDVSQQDLPQCCLGHDCNSNETVLNEPVLQYVGGYIIKKLFLKDEVGTSKWISYITKGGLRTPSDAFNARIKQLEEVFLKLNGCKTIYHGMDYINYHISNSKHVDTTVKVKRLFFRVRLFARIRLINELRESAKKLKLAESKAARASKAMNQLQLNLKTANMTVTDNTRKTKTFKKMKKILT